MGQYIFLYFKGLSSDLGTNFFCQNLSDFLPIKKEDGSPKENMTAHINLSTVLLALYLLNFAFEFWTLQYKVYNVIVQSFEPSSTSL